MMPVINKELYNPSGDGNCSLNGFGIGLLDLYLQGAFNNNERALFLQDFLQNYLREKSLEALLAENIKAIELTLARALREYLIALTEKDFPQEDLDQMILVAFAEYVARKNKIFGASDEDIMFHVFKQNFKDIYQQYDFSNINSLRAIQEKMDSLQTAFTYLLGTEGEGKKLYLAYLRRNGSWLGEWELGRLARQFHVGFTAHRLGLSFPLTADSLENMPKMNMRNDSIHWQVYVSSMLKKHFPSVSLSSNTGKMANTEVIKKTALYHEAEIKLNNIDFNLQSAFSQLSTMVEVQNFLAEGNHKELQEAFDALLALTLDNIHSNGRKKDSEDQVFERAFGQTCSLVSTFFMTKKKEQFEKISEEDSSIQRLMPQAFMAY